MAGAEAGGPCPLEIVATEPAGDVDHLADEVEARDAPRFERAWVEFGGGDPAGGDLGFGVTLGSGRGDAPGMKRLLERGDGGVREVFGGRRRMHGQPALRPPGWQQGANLGRGCSRIAASGGRKQRRENFPARGEIDADGLARTPVGGDLQDGRTAESAMRDQQFFAEARIGAAAVAGFTC